MSAATPVTGAGAGRPDPALRALRVLVLSADVGESHGAMARTLARDLRERTDVDSVQILSELSMLGPRLGAVLARGFRVHLGGQRFSYELAYRVFGRLRAGRALGQAALYALGGRALQDRIARERPHVVVCTYPVFTPILGRLRAAGRVPCPTVAVVEPLGGLAYWTHPGIDLHALMYPEALSEARRLSGEIAAVAARPLVGRQFLQPLSPADGRASLGLEGGRPLVVVSGGGWGVGDVAGAVQASLAAGDVEVIAVTGRNEELRDALEQRFAGSPRVTVLGFTRRMRELLCAAEVFVTATAGLSCMEARLCGTPTICYGFQLGHVRDNTRALARHGLARVARTPQELTRELGAALAAGRRPPPGISALPGVAELVVSLVD